MSHELTDTKKHSFCKEAIKLKYDIEAEYLALGAMLSKIKSEQLWEAGWSSWAEFVMEFKQSQSWESKIIRIHDILHVRLGIPAKTLALAGGWSVVAEYLPLVNEDTKREDVIRWLEDDETRTRVHIRQGVTARKKGVDPDTHKHGKEYYVLKIWSCCGERELIDDTRENPRGSGRLGPR